jgi:hypothetical protein
VKTGSDHVKTGSEHVQTVSVNTVSAVRPRRTRDAVRPVPEPMPTLLAWGAAFAGAAVLLPVPAVAHAPGHHHALALGALCALAAVIGGFAPFAAAPGTAVVCWLMFDGFVAHRMGDLGWAGLPDADRLGVLLAAALAGTAAGRLAAARAAHHRIPWSDTTG